MTIAYEGSVATLDGVATIDEAEELLAFLRSTSDPVVDVTNLLGLHTAVAQILMTSRAVIRGEIKLPSLAACLAVARE